MDASLARAPFRDPGRSPDERARDLLARMTLAEKVAQLGGAWSTALLAGGRFSDEKARVLLADGIGQVTRIGAATLLGPRESAALANAIQRFLVEGTRLGIPALIHEEGVAGFTARGATQFPQAIGLAATFEPALVEAMARVIREQMLAVGARLCLAPVLDVARDPRWGRTEETYGEDPYLAARLAVAYVRGLQGESLAGGVVAAAKHFVGYGVSEGGLNWAPAHLGRRELREVFAAPFAAAIREAGLAGLMNAYHELDGVPCGASREILDDLLRGELGFDGVVVSDYFTVSTLVTYHRVAADREAAARMALAAGLDVELPALDCFRELVAAVEAGRIDAACVDRAVLRGLRQKLELGLFERPFVDADAAPLVFDTPEQRALARRLAEKSLVLLENAGGLLPLSPEIGTLAVVGPAADSTRLLQGDYHYPTHLEIVFGEVDERRDAPPAADSDPSLSDLAPGARARRADLTAHFVPHVSILDGIRARAGPGTRILHAPGCRVRGDDAGELAEALAAARAADAAVVVVGGKSGLCPGATSGESVDAADLGLTGLQQQLVEEVVATGTPTVVVLVNGRPLSLTWIARHVPAVLEAWLPGEEGGHAVAAALFGDVDPAGRLPVSLPRAVGQVPVFYNHKPSGGRSQWKGDYADLPARPLYPFGHGLSYTRFEYADLRVTPGEVPCDGWVEVSSAVRNAGARPGEEVVQLYLRDEVASLSRPVKQLAGFARIALGPGESRRVIFDLDVAQLAFFDHAMRYAVEPGRIEVMVGASSEDIRLRGGFDLVGDPCVLRYPAGEPTRVRVDAV
jgi:beta-glucosidase